MTFYTQITQVEQQLTLPEFMQFPIMSCLAFKVKPQINLLMNTENYYKDLHMQLFFSYPIASLSKQRFGLFQLQSFNLTKKRKVLPEN